MSSDLDLDGGDDTTSPPPPDATSSESGEAEPHEGMEFPSENSAKSFYDNYARRSGFVMRVMGCRKSESDGRILARRLGCNKEGFCTTPINNNNNNNNNNNKRRVVVKKSTREGCKAMLLLKAHYTTNTTNPIEAPKWTVTKFVRDHNHPLVVAPREIRHSMDIRDRKIQELNTEIRNKKRLCALYQDQLTTFMKEVEEHGNQLSNKVQTVVKNLKRFGPLEEDPLQHR